MTDVLIVMSNYLHDLATGLLFGSAVIIYGIGRALGPGSAAARVVLEGLYATISRVMWGALAWVLIGGIPRVIFFKTHELIPAAEKGLYVALGVKHVLMFTAVAVALLLWRGVRRQIGGAHEDGES